MGRSAVEHEEHAAALLAVGDALQLKQITVRF
jgi:hypothetical protein